MTQENEMQGGAVEAKPTATPWSYRFAHCSNSVKSYRIDGAVEQVGKIQSAHDNAEANIAHIVHCVNNHDSLLAALKDLYGDMPWLEGNSYCRFCGRDYSEEEPPEHCSDDCPGEIARIAISKATSPATPGNEGGAGA